MAVLFAKFRAIWGERWVRQFGDERTMELAMTEWGEALVGLGPDQIRVGIDQARSQCAWPPSIAEFVAFAKSGKRPVYFVALPKPKASVGVVRAELSSIWAVLGG